MSPSGLIISPGELDLPFSTFCSVPTTGGLGIFLFQPAASGSGVPAVIGYLNGVKMPHVVEVKVLIVRMLSTIATCVGGLAGGKVGLHFNPFTSSYPILLKPTYNGFYM